MPGDATYAQLTAPFNAAVVQRPVAVVAAADAYDVARAVRLAGRRGLRVAVQCTGHGAAASFDDVLLVHTGALDECSVAPEGWARVGAGMRWRRRGRTAALLFDHPPAATPGTCAGLVRCRPHAQRRPPSNAADAADAASSATRAAKPPPASPD